MLYLILAKLVSDNLTILFGGGVSGDASPFRFENMHMLETFLVTVQVSGRVLLSLVATLNC